MSGSPDTPDSASGDEAIDAALDGEATDVASGGGVFDANSGDDAGFRRVINPKKRQRELSDRDGV